CTASNTVTAKVVALEQVYFYNRFGAFNPEGMMYALRRDVIESKEEGRDEQDGHPIPSEPGEWDKGLAGQVKLRQDKRPRPLILRVNEGDCLEVTFTNLLSPYPSGQEVYAKDPATGLYTIDDHEIDLKDPKMPSVMVMDGEDPTTRHASMHVNGLNYLPDPSGQEPGIMSDGSNVGRNPSSLAAPGETQTYRWRAKKEGGYLFYSMGAPAGGEGDGGQLGLGLFGSVNVQPKGAKWYRSQVSAEDLRLATTGQTSYGQPILNYEKIYPNGDPILNMLKCQSPGTREDCEIIYSDLNAVIDLPEGEKHCPQQGEGNSCGEPYREFTTIFHDELEAVQGFLELEDENSPMHSLRDGMGINYGAGGLGAALLASHNKVGPAKDCVECKLEEFFLSSWANGDPAMVLGAKKDVAGQVQISTKDGKIVPLLEAKYPDDPSNVHHSYLGDSVRFRNMHAGPKETHVFHLHAHQWVQDKHDPHSHYLDSQTISPGSVFSYEIHYGGSGNRNFTPGDSIFHCHLYPHFAQGMWELWRTHDVFEDGTSGLYDPKQPMSPSNHPGMRNLPDGEILAGTPNPSVVPLPHTPLPPMPTADFPGYPFYIAGKAGHRPPQPPMDLDDSHDPTTLQRHVVVGGTLKPEPEAVQEALTPPSAPACDAPRQPEEDLYDKSKRDSACIAKRVHEQNDNPAFLELARELESADILPLPLEGTSEEQRAMKFHEGELEIHGSKAVRKDHPQWTPTSYNFDARGYPTCDAAGNCDSPESPVLFRVNGSPPQSGAPYADPCPATFYDATGQVNQVNQRDYAAAYVQFDMTVNKHGWHDPQARIIVLEQDVKETLDGTRPSEPFFFRVRSGECVKFKATNLIPSNLNLDDFQIYSPTDVIGQHIHLVKFDVTSSDGSANGWNYEDGTLSPDEIRERIAANNVFQQHIPGGRILKPKTHRLFASGELAEGINQDRGTCPDSMDPKEWAKHPWCGAQTTIQRWWADPLLDQKPGMDGAHDRTLRTVFTHDHFGPSSHQHHGFYAALVVEPTNSKWHFVDGRIMGGADALGKPVTVTEITTTPQGQVKEETRVDGGPTSYAANIIVRKKGHACIDVHDPQCNANLDNVGTVDSLHTAREYNLAVADYGIVYDKKNQPINPVNVLDHSLPNPTVHGSIPEPEGISTKDPGTQLMNYRTEPIPLRIGEPSSNGQWTQKLGPDGDMANVFSTKRHGPSDTFHDNPLQPLFTEPLGKARLPGDPATPLLRAYQGDRVQIRLIQGAQEENHLFNMHGVKWLSQPESPYSGYVNSQPIGISEHFEFDVKFLAPNDRINTDYLYSSPAADNLWDGQWGLLRAFGAGKDATFAETGGLARLPSNPKGFRHREGAGVSVCPDGAPPATEDPILITAILVKDLFKDTPLPDSQKTLFYNRAFGIHDPNAMVFIKDDDRADIIKGKKRLEPLILRAHAGDCISVTLKNELPETMPDSDPNNPQHWSYNTMSPIVDGFNFNQVRSSNRVSLHPQLVAVNIHNHDGANVGNNKDSTVGSGSQKDFTWYAGDLTYDDTGKLLPAPIEFGVVGLRDMADVIKHSSHGAIGALVIEPKGSILEPSDEHPDCGPDPGQEAAATICDKDGNKLFREFVLLYQDDVSLQWHGQPLANLRNADDSEDSGQKAFNYRTEPIWARLGVDPGADPGAMMELDWSEAFSSRTSHQACQADPNKGKFCDPETPIFTAKAGDDVRFRVVHVAGKPRNHGFTLNGHDWNLTPWECEDPTDLDVPHDANKQSCDSTKMGWNKFASNRVGSIGGIGPTRHINIVTKAGGESNLPGDYLYRTQEGFAFAGGLWGIFRVEEAKNSVKPAQHRDTQP
ncbi:MAG: hypothetical protein ABI618_01460, partial [Nitrospirota bacterium]